MSLSKKTYIHKDFHGAMSVGLEYLYKEYGKKEMENYLREVARNVYKPLSHKISKYGLSALYEHWNRIFTVEGAEFLLYYKNRALVLEVKKCPAIRHMKIHKYHIFKYFCEHTRIINEEICSQSGYQCSIDYNQNNGCCIQRFFWK